VTKTISSGGSGYSGCGGCGGSGGSGVVLDAKVNFTFNL
jgi:hypothetical protein